jgi:predicted nucleic acid-binding protein
VTSAGAGLVIDASLAMAWYFADEGTEATEALLDRVTRGGAVVPSHWKLEVANAL